MLFQEKFKVMKLAKNKHTKKDVIVEDLGVKKNIASVIVQE